MSTSGHIPIVDKVLTSLINDEVDAYRILVMPSVIEEIDYADVSKIMEEVKGLDEEIIYLLQAYASCRISEALACQMKHLDLRRNVVIVDQQVYQVPSRWLEGHNKSGQDRLGITRMLKTKNSRREIPMCDAIRKWVLAHQHLAPDDLVYATRSGGICSFSNWYTRHHAPLMNRLGLKGKFIARTHSLRKFYISSQKRSGVDEATICKQAGSSMDVISKHYVKILLDETVEEKNPEDDLKAYQARAREKKIIQFNDPYQSQDSAVGNNR